MARFPRRRHRHRRAFTRARYLLARLMERAREQGVGVPAMVTSDYINTIPPEQEPWFPGDEVLERRIRSYIRWNAMAMVDRSNHRFDGLGGHLSTFASAAALYDVGFNHFFRGKGDGGAGDQVFFQGHAAPGVYARAFLEGRLNEEHLDRFRREVDGGGLPSYPHPRRMPTFWEFPTVSMGLGPLNAVAQARFNRYLMARELADTSKSKVWAFLGDGEMDEPEAMAGLSLAAREQLDNLIFVVNCNLQRLDGPVRGNGKIIQELEATFRGAGWNVIKVIWGHGWDELLARDVDGVLVNQMNSTVDGQFQKYAVESGAYIREHFFGPDPRLQRMVEHLSDDDLRMLPAAGTTTASCSPPTRWPSSTRAAPPSSWRRRSRAGRSARASSRATPPTRSRSSRPRNCGRSATGLQIPIPDADVDDGDPPFFHPGTDSPEFEYMMARRRALGGSVPERVVKPKSFSVPVREHTETPRRERGPVRRQLRRHRREGAGEHHHRVRASAAQPAARSRHRRARRPDHPRRSAHVRSRRAVPRVQDLRAVRSALRAGRRRTAALVPRGEQRSHPRRGDHRGGVDGDAHRGGHVVRDVEPADDPVLHLLFDVRVPARRRPHLGVRRPARSRLPARRHRGSHDARG